MSSFHYSNLEKNEKEIFLPNIFNILKLFCRNKDELCVLIDDLQKNVKKLDDFCIEDEKEERKEVESEKKKKKIIEVKKKEWRFADLSPNVIVYNVLPFRVIVSDEIKNKLELYGYFKLDRLRNIWFIFTSVWVCRVIYIPFYVNIERLMYLRCCGRFFMKNNDKSFESFNFKNLESTCIYKFNTENELSPFTIESIQKNNKFYKLKSIEICNDLDVTEKLNVINLQGIKNLKIWIGEWLLLDPNNLRLLDLNYVDLKGYENWGQMINVEKLKVRFCDFEGDLNSFFKVHKFEKLKEFIFNHDLDIQNVNVDNSLENVRVRWNYLQKIQISVVDFCNFLTIITDKFFVNNEFKNLKTIELSGLDLITGNNWKVSSRIKSFYIKNCLNFEPSFFKRKEMKNVEKITCINCRKINNEIEIFKKKIEEFTNKEECSNLNSLIKNRIQNIVCKMKGDELCNLKCLVLGDKTYEK